MRTIVIDQLRSNRPVRAERPAYRERRLSALNFGRACITTHRICVMRRSKIRRLTKRRLSDWMRGQIDDLFSALTKDDPRGHGHSKP